MHFLIFGFSFNILKFSLREMEHYFNSMLLGSRGNMQI